MIKKFCIWVFKHSLWMLAIQLTLIVFQLVAMIFGIQWLSRGIGIEAITLFTIQTLTFTHGWHREITWDERGTDWQQLCGWLRNHDYVLDYVYEKEENLMYRYHCRKCWHKLETTENLTGVELPEWFVKTRDE